MSKNNIQSELDNKKERLKLYYDREKQMLSPTGVKSYGIGTRNLQRYDTALKDIQDMIKKLEDEIADLENTAGGRKSRTAVAIVAQDW